MLFRAGSHRVELHKSPLPSPTSPGTGYTLPPAGKPLEWQGRVEAPGSGPGTPGFFRTGHPAGSSEWKAFLRRLVIPRSRAELGTGRMSLALVEWLLGFQCPASRLWAPARAAPPCYHEDQDCVHTAVGLTPDPEGGPPEREDLRGGRTSGERGPASSQASTHTPFPG